MNLLSYGRQDISPEDIAAIVKILQSDYLTQGPAVESFENAFSEVCSSGYAVACSNGTAALHLAMLAAGVGEGDRVIVPPITFVSSANCARFNKAEVIFADIDEQSLCLSPVECEKQLIRAREQNRPVKAVVSVDMAGHPCDMQAFARLKKEYEFVWIQDACHSPGAQWLDEQQRWWKTGEWTIPDMTVYSFHPVKHITSGEGGMITTHSAQLDKMLRLYRTHGITKDAAAFVAPEQAFSAEGEANPWYYEMQVLGYNYRLSDIQAALGESQLGRLDTFIARRQQVAGLYYEYLQEVPAVTPISINTDIKHAYHLFIVKIDFAAVKKSRAQVMKELRALGIGTQVHYIPVPMMPYYAKNTCLAEIPKAMAYYRQALTLPCFYQMTDEDVARVCQALKEVIA